MLCKHIRTVQSGVAAIVILALVSLIAGCCTPPDEASTTTTPTASLSTPVPTPMPTTVVSGPALLFLKPSVVPDIAVGETRHVEVMLENVTELHELDLHISFEPRYISIEDADLDMEGVQVEPGVMPAPAQVLENNVNNDTGFIVYHVAQEEETSARGSGVVASFTIRAMVEGGSRLEFTIVNFYDADGQEIEVPDPIHGLVTISAGATASDPRATPTESAPAVPTASAPDATVPVPTASPATGDVYHTVQAGDTLYSIANRYGTTVDAVMAANGITDPGALQVGQELLIPGGETPGGTTYVVQSGDTLYSIAQRFDTTVEGLAALNNLTPPYTLSVGQELIVSP